MSTIRSPLTSFLFFFNDAATTVIYTLSLHDALPIYREGRRTANYFQSDVRRNGAFGGLRERDYAADLQMLHRSEEHTSELQSHVNLVCRLLLEKKKNKNTKSIDTIRSCDERDTSWKQ